MIHTLLSQIPALCQFNDVTPIHKGFSADQKYVVTVHSGEKRLLKLFDMSRYEVKRQEYEILKQMKLLNVNCTRSIAIG